MATVELFEKIPGIPSAGPNGGYEDPLNYVFSHHESVERAIVAYVQPRAAKASAVLAAARHSGFSGIQVEGGAVDYYVWLYDMDPVTKKDKNPARGVYAIEFGRKGGRGGVAPLHKAFPEANFIG